jgi:acyl-CoA dehydrogenase
LLNPESGNRLGDLGGYGRLGLGPVQFWRLCGMVAQANAGVAFHFHQLALGDYVRRRLGLICGPPSVVCLQGTFGLARYSLARLLKSKPLDDDDRAVLKDYFFTPGASEPKPLLFQAAEDWQQLVVPCLDEHCQLSWSAFAREDLDLQALPHSHGLNETLVWQWQPGDTPPRRVTAEQAAAGHDAGVATYIAAFQLNAVALIAIAWGAVQQGYDKAREYAALRRQGGAPIQQHAAVRLMLATGGGRAAHRRSVVRSTGLSAGRSR